MEKILATTALYKNYQLTIPEAIRNKFKELDCEGTVIDWSVNENNEIIIRPRKVGLVDVIGIIEDDDSRNAAELKRDLYNSCND